MINTAVQVRAGPPASHPHNPMNSNLLWRVAQFLSSRQTRTELGYDHDRCIQERVVPLPLPPIYHPKLSQMLHYRYIECCRRMRGYFSISFLMKETAMTVNIRMKFLTPVLEFTMVVITDVEVLPENRYNLIITRSQPPRSWQRILHWPENTFQELIPNQYIVVSVDYVISS